MKIFLAITFLIQVINTFIQYYSGNIEKAIFWAVMSLLMAFIFETYNPTPNL